MLDIPIFEAYSAAITKYDIFTIFIPSVACILISVRYYVEILFINLAV